MTVKKVTNRLIKQLRLFAKRLWLLSPWTIFFVALSLVFFTEVSTLVIQHLHTKQVAVISHQTNSAANNNTLCVYGENNCGVNTNHVLATPKQSPPNPAPSSSTSTSKPSPYTPTPTSQSPKATPTVSMCDYDTYDKSVLANEYVNIIDAYLTAHVNADQGQTAAYAISDLNNTISYANGEYTQSYDEYVSARQNYHCTIDVSAPAPIPLCPGTDTVANCIDNITVNEPDAPTY